MPRPSAQAISSTLLQAGDRDLEGLVLDEILEDLGSRQDAMKRLLRDGG